MPNQIVPLRPIGQRPITQQVNGFSREAIAFHTRTLTSAIRVARAAPWQYRHHGATAAAVDEALGIAFDHCLEAACAGQTPCDMLHAIVVRDASRLTTWGDAIARLVAIWLAEVWPKLPHQSRGPP
jgi:hypothetical protein